MPRLAETSRSNTETSAILENPSQNRVGEATIGKPAEQKSMHGINRIEAW